VHFELVFSENVWVNCPNYVLINGVAFQHLPEVWFSIIGIHVWYDIIFKAFIDKK